MRQNFSAALDYYKEATLVDPRNPASYAELGRAHSLLEDYPSAKAALEKGIEQDPTFGPNYAHLGYVYYLQRNFEGAISEMEKAISFGYSSEEVFNNLGLSHAYLEQCEDAKVWLERALALNPESVPAIYGLELCELPAAVPEELDENYRKLCQNYQKSKPLSAICVAPNLSGAKFVILPCVGPVH